MAKSTKHIEGGGSQKKRRKVRDKKYIKPDKSGGRKFPKPHKPADKIKEAQKKPYSSSYLDLSPNTPGKYGVDY